jgi:hypothetical protein
MQWPKKKPRLYFGPAPEPAAGAGALGDADAEVVRRRSPEWNEHQLRWRWLLDSLEGGERYRQAVYGYDIRGLPVRNLIRHKREYPLPSDSALSNVYALPNGIASGAPGAVGSDPAALATDDDYELRRARTPVPTFLGETIETHVSRIFAREVNRDGPPELIEWWGDVDGRGTCIDDWISDEVGPLLLALGQLDIYFDHPKAPDGEKVENQADVLRLGLSRCVASYILPENMLWWCLDDRGRYRECLVREFPDGGDAPMPGAPIAPSHTSRVFFRHWTATGWTLRDATGQVLETGAHAFGRVPIERIFDRRKPRCKNVGMSRYEAIAEIQREFYNRDSELVLSDSLQAHPLLQGPEDYCTADGEMPIGPGFMLPMKKTGAGTDHSYHGFEYVCPDKDAAESIRKNKSDLRDEADRSGKLTKPAGSAGTTGKTVGQSGVSKWIDKDDGNDLLGKLAKVLGRFENTCADLALLVLNEGRESDVEIKIDYPAEFDLFSLDELLDATASFQGIAAKSGMAPEVESALMQAIIRRVLPGKEDAVYAAYDAEIRALIDARATAAAQTAEETANGGPAMQMGDTFSTAVD